MALEGFQRIPAQDQRRNDQVYGDQASQPVADHFVNRQVRRGQHLVEHVVGSDQQGHDGGDEHEQEGDQRPQVLLAIGHQPQGDQQQRQCSHQLVCTAEEHPDARPEAGVDQDGRKEQGHEGAKGGVLEQRHLIAQEFCRSHPHEAHHQVHDRQRHQAQEDRAIGQAKGGGDADLGHHLAQAHRKDAGILPGCDHADVTGKALGHANAYHCGQQ